MIRYLSPSEAARVIGVAPEHVRLLIRRGHIKARKKRGPNTPRGFRTYKYQIAESEAVRYRDLPISRGKPRSYDLRRRKQ